MFKLLRLVFTCLAICGAFILGGILQDRNTLSDEVIRLHVVAASDSEADQAVKLQIRDAVVAQLNEKMAEFPTAADAKVFLAAHLTDIEDVANGVLEKAGFADRATVSFDREAFDTRVYDTFTLPAGVYESLRIVVGDGHGKNWWCVVFPGLCIPQTEDDFAGAAVGAGFSETLTQTIGNEEGYEVRFFILDCLGRLQNLFHKS